MTYFRHVTLGPVISFFMPPTVFASSPHEMEQTLLSLSSDTSASTNSTVTSSQILSLFTGHSTSSSVLIYDSLDTAASASNKIPDPPKIPAPSKSFVLDMGMDGEEPTILPDLIPLRNQLSQLNE
ncbi:hypothetical protein MVEN_02121000 [Mycena venus]|uniref:Uncharacterized protein n=1 Tax=Mycena venus TaxID=2733690 RepID=A0A8H6XA34_9AGAR|nr:hypothetical protein MVEN_02121000 [Mycena venus]